MSLSANGYKRPRESLLRLSERERRTTVNYLKKKKNTIVNNQADHFRLKKIEQQNLSSLGVDSNHF